MVELVAIGYDPSLAIAGMVNCLHDDAITFREVGP
jgi:hypothetical protein